MVLALVILGGLGLVVGIGLAVASKVFYVYVDPLILDIEGALPGANCGGCGLPGCSANAEAIARGKASPTSCVAANAEVVAAIAAILGVSVEAKEPEIARPGCTYGTDSADLKYTYDGIADCRAAAMLDGGMKVCSVGCLGLGTCAKACPFGAIAMGANHLPAVDAAKCTGCGTCERVCPKRIITLSSVTRRILKEYTVEECTTPCQRACPAGIDICEYIRQIQLGDYTRAVQVIKERNPFPTVIGRICPRPCEQECRRQLVDEPVAINFLKRFVADYEKSKGERVQPFKAPATQRRLAVIGGGVQGLSTAFFLARLGHAPTVFEATGQLGGLLRTAIARNRLPQEVLDWDIAGIQELGVATETGKMLGRDMSLADLLTQGYQAIFLAEGGWDSRLIRTRGQGEEPLSLPGVRLLVELLAFGAALDLSGQSVAIAGGGAQALQAAEQCRTQGAHRVTILFPEEAGQLELDAAQCDAARAAGVELRFAAGVSRLTGQGEQLQSVTVAQWDGQTQELSTDLLVIAAGRMPELIIKPAAVAEAEAAVTAGVWEGVLPYKAPAFFGVHGILAPGDPLSDFTAAIRAIGAGRRAAASVHQVIFGLPVSLPATVLTPQAVIQNVSQVEQVKSAQRVLMPLKPDALDHEEVELGFDEAMARREAGRCLQCGLICYRRMPSPTTRLEDRQAA